MQILHRVFAIYFGQLKFAGGYIDIGKTNRFLIYIYGSQIIVGPFIEHKIFNNRPGADDTDNFAFDNAGGLLRVFNLLAYGHFITAADETRQVIIDGVIRDPAHRDLLLPAVTGSQYDFQFPCSQYRIFKEHFVKITQSEKQDCILMIGFDFQVLFDHGCEFGQTDPPSQYEKRLDQMIKPLKIQIPNQVFSLYITPHPPPQESQPDEQESLPDMA